MAWVSIADENAADPQWRRYGLHGDKTIGERVRRDKRFARSLLDEAATLFLNGEPEAARLLLRDLVNSTVGFETLSELTNKPAKSLHRMLSKHGRPSMDNLAVIFDAVRQRLKVELKAQVVRAAKLDV